MIRPMLFALALLFVAYLFLGESSRDQPDGVLVPEVPIQTTATRPPFEFEGYRIKPLASFSLEARVLSKERYWLDRESDLAKYDLALGWGAMSDNRVLDVIEISQSGRWYRWRTDRLPIPRRELERSSANMHMVAASDWIEKQIGKAVPGSMVRLEGFLIQAESPDGWRWKSSLTRDDIGQGACELIFVESFEIL